jgi:hypothetical protein
VGGPCHAKEETMGQLRKMIGQHSVEFEVHEESPEHYSGIARSADGNLYHIKATSNGQTLKLEAQTDDKFPSYFGGEHNWQKPNVDQRHPVFMLLFYGAGTIVILFCGVYGLFRVFWAPTTASVAPSRTLVAKD